MYCMSRQCKVMTLVTGQSLTYYNCKKVRKKGVQILSFVMFQEICRASGGHLAWIDSAEENAFIATTVRPSGKFRKKNHLCLAFIHLTIPTHVLSNLKLK